MIQKETKEAHKMAVRFNMTGLPHFEDVDREFDRVVKAGAKPVMEPKDMPWGQRSAIVADPDGNFIEIGSFNSGEKTP